MKREQTRSFVPYNFVQSARPREKKEMAAIIADENAFHAQDFDPNFSYELEPEVRSLDRNSQGWSVKVSTVCPDGPNVYFEQFARCKACREIVLLAGGCTVCTFCDVLLEDNN